MLLGCCWFMVLSFCVCVLFVGLAVFGLGFGLRGLGFLAGG